MLHHPSERKNSFLFGKQFSLAVQCYRVFQLNFHRSLYSDSISFSNYKSYTEFDSFYQEELELSTLKHICRPSEKTFDRVSSHQFVRVSSRRNPTHWRYRISVTTSISLLQSSQFAELFGGFSELERSKAHWTEIFTTDRESNSVRPLFEGKSILLGLCDFLVDLTRWRTLHCAQQNSTSGSPIALKMLWG